jgi:asparagine synthase (glutamine-hydrolysing)
MMLARRDEFGWGRLYYSVRSGDHAGTMRELFERDAALPRTLDRLAITAHLEGRRLTDRSVFEAVRSVPPGHALLAGGGVNRHEEAPRPGNLLQLMRDAVERALASGKRVALALSGGLDSALLLSLLNDLGRREVPAYILAAGLQGYSELDAALATARFAGVEPVVVRVGAADFVAALPDAVRQIEEPLYNAHPVAKLLLARAMRRDGIELALSGDGADQVLRRDYSADYLPLCKALFDAAEVELRSPYLDADVVAHLLSLPPDPDKHCLRTLAAALPVPAELVTRSKQSRLAPPLPLDSLRMQSRIVALAAWLGREAGTFADDRQRMLWTTLALLCEAFEVAV